MMKLGGSVRCTKISPQFEFGVKGQRSKVKVTRGKKRKSAAFFSGAVLRGGPQGPCVWGMFEKTSLA